MSLITRPVIFLDIDGVLNSVRFQMTSKAKGFDCIDPEAVGRVNDIASLTNAIVVVSSSWRLMMPLSDLRRRLVNHGSRFAIVDKTPSMLSRPRGHEIEAFLQDHPRIPSFVILDDENDMDRLGPYLVQTDPEVGLQDADAERAVSFLRYPPPT